MIESYAKRIGIFVYNMSIQHYIKDFVIKSAEAGYLIDLFLKDWSIRPNFANTNDFALYENIRFFDFTTKETGIQAINRRYIKLLNKMAMWCSAPRNYGPNRIIDRDVMARSKEIVKKSKYYALVGIEKEGLIWAGSVSEIQHCPLIYFSLELYIEDNPACFRIYHLRDAERKYHRQAVATIIQDKPRADALLKANGIEQANVLHFPVSARGNIVREKTKFIQNKFKIPDGKKIILYYGAIQKDRFITEIVENAKDMDDDIMLVVHGVGSKKYIEYLQSIACKNKVVFSLEFIAENEIQSLVSSADIGIALYKTTNANDRLVAFSSSKVAFYTQCGIPMIAFATESFMELVSCHKCAELINNIDEIPDKARKILDNYGYYRENAHSAFQQFYNVDENCSRLINKLEGIIDDAQTDSDGCVQSCSGIAGG